MLVTCFSTAASVTTSVAAIPWFDLPSAIAASTSRSRGLNDVERTGGATAAEHPADDLGVERAAAGGDAADRLDERVDVADALLQQIADAGRLVADQVDRVVLLVVLREHQHAGLRPLRAQLLGGAQAVVGAAGRHLHVDHDDVGSVRERLAQEVLGVAGGRDDVEALGGEQPLDPRAQQHVVLADHHSQRHRRKRIGSHRRAA